MSDFEDTIQIEGRKLRVWADLIQQAADHLALTNADFVTFLCVADTAVSLHTGVRRMTVPRAITPRRDMLSVTIDEDEERAGRAQRRSPITPKGAKRKGTTRKGIRHQPRNIDAERVVSIFENDPKTPFSARDIGDLLRMERADASMRSGVSRLLAEFRASGIIRPTSKTKMPDYIFVDRPAPSEDTEVTEDNIQAVLQNANRPLAFGVIADLFGVSRSDSGRRREFSTILQRMARAGTLREAGEAAKTVVYDLVNPGPR